MEKEKLKTQRSGKEVEIVSCYDENGKSFDELMRELIREFLSA